MRRLGRLGAATLLLFLTTAALAPRAEAAKAEAARSGWLATSVRFEPIDAASSGPIEVDEVGLYRGAIEVVPAPAGVAVINHVDVEDYVRGISEVPPTWPAEAQRAQAIAARTYALWEWNRTGVSAAYKDLGADICATDACQVYRGVVRERQDDSAGWLAAVDATRSRAIYWRDAPIKAMYSSSNGGIMAAGAERYLRGGVDPDDRWSPLHRWSVTLDLARVVEAAELPPATKSIHRDGDTIWAVAPGLDGPALAALPVNEFRLRLNRGLDRPEGVPLPLPTVRFGLATVEGQLRAEGMGWGHAIGMSQWGAYGKARRGMKADDILAAYYAGLRPVDVPESRLPGALKVAVDLGRSSATVAPESGRFRVIAGDGTVLAHAASGEWTVAPAAGGHITVTPPAADPADGAVRVTNIGPASVQPGQAVVLTLAVLQTATVTIQAAPPGVEPIPVSLGLVEAGPIEVRLPAATATGTYRAVVQADIGGGRVLSTPVDVQVVSLEQQRLAAAATGPRSSGRPIVLPVTMASTLLLAVTTWLFRIGRSYRPRLH